MLKRLKKMGVFSTRLCEHTECDLTLSLKPRLIFLSYSPSFFMLFLFFLSIPKLSPLFQSGIIDGIRKILSHSLKDKHNIYTYRHIYTDTHPHARTHAHTHTYMCIHVCVWSVQKGLRKRLKSMTERIRYFKYH